MFRSANLTFASLVLLSWACTGSLASALAAAEETAADAVILNPKGDGVKKDEANQTFIGFSSTQVFYTLQSRAAVVVMHIDNKDKAFPVSGVVYQFAKGVTAEDLAKWVNNQHSDGLFPDIPEPVATHKLPADSLKTGASKLLGQIQGGPENESFDKYTVEFKAAETELAPKLKLGSFQDTATVYVKSTPKEQ